MEQLLDNKIIMGVDSLIQLCTWVDDEYGVQTKLKIHTGGCMSFGYGMVYCNPIKKKLSTKSSTEAKIVDVSDYLPYNIWIFKFTGAQAYEIKQNILF